MRLLHALFMLPLFYAAPVLADSAAPPGAEHHARQTAEEHFAEANSTHDGRLTLPQATTGFKSIAKAFAQIDVNRHGYVTLEDIKAWKAAKKAARQAAKHAADDAAAGVVRPTPAMQYGTNPRATDTSTGMMVPSYQDRPRMGVDLPTAPLDGANTRS